MENTLVQNQERRETATEVRILGGRYTIKSGYDAAFVQRTAALVNERMHSLMKDGGVISTDKIAILACMGIASELLRLQEENQNLKDNLREGFKRRLEKILKAIENGLANTTPSKSEGKPEEKMAGPKNKSTVDEERYINGTLFNF